MQDAHLALTIRRLLFVGFALLYAGTVHRGVEGDELFHHQVAHNVLETGHFSLPDDYRAKRPYPLFYRTGRDGHVYSVLPPGLAAVSLPAAAVGYVATGGDFDTTAKLAAMVSPVIGAALVAVFFSLCILLGAPVRRAGIGAVVLGAGTIIWPYATSHWTELPVALCVVGAIYAVELWSRERRDAGLAAIAGALLGASVLFRYDAVLIVPWVLLLFGLRCRDRDPVRAWAAILAPLAVVAAVLMAWNAYRFGGPLDTGSAHQRARDFGAPWSKSLPFLLVSPNASLLLFSPPLVLALARARRLWTAERALCVVLGGIAVSQVLFYGKFILYDGDNTWGPRLLLVVVPVLMVAAVVGRGRDRPLIAVGILGAMIQLLGVCIDWDRQAVNAFFLDGEVAHFFASEIVEAARNLDQFPRRLWWMSGGANAAVGIAALAGAGAAGWALARRLRS